MYYQISREKNTGSFRITIIFFPYQVIFYWGILYTLQIIALWIIQDNDCWWLYI